jgi:integrase
MCRAGTVRPRITLMEDTRLYPWPRRARERRRHVLTSGKEAKKAAQAATARAAMTLSAVYDKWYAWMLPGMRARTAQGYKNPFIRNEKCRVLAAKPVNSFEIEDAYAILCERFGERITPQLQEWRARLQAIVDYAEGHRWREPGKRNPFTWKGGLQIKFPKSNYVKNGRRPMGYFRMPEHMRMLRTKGNIPALSLEILILSGSRSGTMRKARWSEVDLENLVWTRPPENMKQRRTNLHDHAVPITPRMAAIFRYLYSIRTDDGLIFPSPNGVVIHAGCWAGLLPENVDVHGLRTDLENWRQEKTKFTTDVGAVQLDNVIRASEFDLIAASSTIRAYARSPLYNKRRKMMNAWDEYLRDGADDWEKVHLAPELPKPKRTVSRYS